MSQTNPFLKTELPLTAAAGYLVYEVAMVEGGPSWQQAACAISIAVLGSAYTLGRSWVKRTTTAGEQAPAKHSRRK